jgi:GT2 family glycosyltransferase
MKVAIVILNYNGVELLAQFLPSVIQHSKASHQIYIIDNNSTDTSKHYIALHFPNVFWIQNNKNYGFAEGYNVGLKDIPADIYILLNSDVEVTNNWIEPIIEQFAQEPNTAAIQPKIKDYKQKNYFEYAGAAGGMLDYLGYAFCRGRIFNSLEEDENQYNNEADIQWASGAAMCIRSKLFHTFNGFDANFFAHMEEIDLCWRLRRAGFNIKYQPKSTIYHLGGASLKKVNPFKTFLNFRNALLMCVKNMPYFQLLWFIPFRLILDGIAGLQMILKGEIQHCIAIIKAHLAFYKSINKILIEKDKQNKIIQTFSIINVNKNYPKSILWLHFIHKINKFSDIKN